MAKRGYKLQEFVAHQANVNCLNIGKKACRLFITGGDDFKVNLWSIGKPNSLMSLCGHTSPVESLAFDTAEVLVLGGASSGVIRLWDLEEAKMVRTLTGHRANCTALEFHPFGEFFASGSSDMNLKIWDIRKKGTIHTYKGHTRDISTIKFTPDGRWVVSGGLDNAVKVWDLTAGKLLHDFKFHDGHIRSLDFHPLEFLLATGSADGTVKFWDLETFELIGSARPEATGVRAMAFHPDGQSIFCGFDDSLKVYSWEPVIRHDAVDIGWSTLSDLGFQEEKLLGCSYYRNSVAVWVADVALIEPYGVGFIPEENDGTNKKFSIPKINSPDKVRSGIRSPSDFRSVSPDYQNKEIKNIYVDSSGGKPVSSQKISSFTSSKMAPPLDSEEMSKLPLEKKIPITGVDAKAGGYPLNKSFAVPAVVPCDSPTGKNSNSGRETVTFSRTKPGMLLRPAHTRRPSNTKNDVDKLSVSLESEKFFDIPSEKESIIDLKVQTLEVPEERPVKVSEEKPPMIKDVTEKVEKILSPETPSSRENCDESVNGNSGSPSVKIVNGVAVVSGRTRSLVERFERREMFSNEDQSTTVESSSIDETSCSPAISNNVNRVSIPEAAKKPPIAARVVPETKTTHSLTHVISCISPETNEIPIAASAMTPHVIPEMDRTPISAIDTTTHVIPETDRTPIATSTMARRVLPERSRIPISATDTPTHVGQETDRTPISKAAVARRVLPERSRTPISATDTPTHVISETDRTPIATTTVTRRVLPERSRTSIATSYATSRVIHVRDRSPSTAHRAVRERDRTPPIVEEPQISGRDSVSSNYTEITEELMLTHDIFLSTVKSRLTKLQVIRHFWERNDIKGAVNALRKLPDHSVQADVISVLIEKMEILTLDLFSCLLPVLLGLLDSKMERHISVSLEMLLKLVAVFGPTVRSTVSGPPPVGVDLHQEQRRECCRQCFDQLQKIQQILPMLGRKGGVLAKSALELNLVLQES